MSNLQMPIKKSRRSLFLPAVLVFFAIMLLFRLVETAYDGKELMQAMNIWGSVAIAEDIPADINALAQKNNNVFAPAPEVSSRNLLEEELSFSSSEVEILQSLSKRREELQKKEQSLEQREALLAAAEKQIESKMNELTSLRKEIEGLLGKQQAEQEERISSLVKMYETMKAKDAARIFDTLELDVLLSVISKMSERKAAPILAQMKPERAQTVTIKLAEQKKLPQLSDNNQ